MSFSATDNMLNSNGSTQEERDEIKEVQRFAKRDTNLVRTWRCIVVVAILAAAVAVTVTSYGLLKREERRNFEAAFHDLASTLEASALEQQRNIRKGFKAMADTITSFAVTTNANWPFVTPKHFEAHAGNLRRISAVEALWVTHRVEHYQREEFLKYVDANYNDTVKESFEIDPSTKHYFEGGQYEPYFRIVTDEGWVPDFDRDHYYPTYQQSPPPFHYLLVNYNLMGVQDYIDIMNAGDTLKNQTLFTRVRKYSAFTDKDHANLHSNLKNQETDHPHSFVFQPIHEEIANTDSKVVGYVLGATAWDTALRKIMPAGVEGIYAVVRNTCNQSFTYELVGPDAYFLGNGDLHETQYDHISKSLDLMAINTHADYTTTPGHCLYELTIYPGAKFASMYDTGTPETFSSIIAIAFLGMILVFIVYDVMVQRRNHKMISSAARSNAIVSSVFPSNIRDRLIGNDCNVSLTSFLTSGKDAGAHDSNARPLADLMLETTIIFADIVGFTAWSSVREPSQVFLLLETIFASFDDIAKHHRVFKVETVGDCFVGATGIPVPQKDHAIQMIRFARAIVREMSVVTKRLEVTLGPDTGDLSLRIGINSGPVTAGVLRGERARFQLFGDVMNVCSRMESTGIANRIQLSQSTAELLINSGKGHWIVRRADTVSVKGKGDMKTFWVRSGNCEKLQEEGNSKADVSHGVSANGVEESEEALQRLIEWNVSALLPILKDIVASRQISTEINADTNVFSPEKERNNGVTPFPLEEVVETITLPSFDAYAATRRKNAGKVEINTLVAAQLHNYVACVADLYKNNSFHNFDHASHVVMSVIKLLSRIVAPSDVELSGEGGREATLHDHTYGITSDPLTQFACAFSALIHDVDHSGVPNNKLIEEESPLASLYSNRSIAEQNSLNLAWNLLMEDRFKEFRSAVCKTPEEIRRFRQLVVNGVMATDISDKKLKALRNARWEKAFSTIGTIKESKNETVNRKATIVIEHLIQASDVAHTMQHWHVYRKWNELFFIECYAAYKAGRERTDPSVNWYKGEIGFFDFYIIPLARKLKECGVFGKSSDEYLNYALTNRMEWEQRGQEVVNEMLANINRTAGVCEEDQLSC